jgi:protein O-mannosyl-transferase
MAKVQKQAAAKAVETKTIPVALPGWLKPDKRHAWFLFLFGFLLYANTFRFGYALDDAIVITDNMFTEKGIAGIPGLLQYDTFYGFFKDPSKARLVSGGRYRPMTPVMFAIEKSLFGKHQAMAGHIINAILYGLTGVLLYWLIILMFREGKEQVFVALGASMLFLSHPTHTEAVANIKGRDEIVALLGSLAALYFVLKAYRQSRPLWVFVAMAAFFAALMSKENAITFLAIVPLSFYFFTAANLRQTVLYTAPLMAVALIFLIIRGSVLGWQLGDPPMELMNNPFLKIVGDRWVPFSVSEKSATIMHTLAEYLRLLLLPYKLTHDYYPRHIDIGSWTDLSVLIALILHVGLLILAFTGLRRKDPVSYGIFFYLITLSIASNIVFPVGTNMSERFIYMPSIGFVLVVTIWLYRLMKAGGVGRLKTGLQLLAVIAVVFSVRTLSRNEVWKDNYTLFLTDVQHSPNSAKLRNAAGGELFTQSIKPENEQLRESMLREALGHLREAIRIHPTYKNAFLLQGNCHYYLQDYESAIQSYRQALLIDPVYKDAIENLGITYRDAGKYFGEQKGDLVKALEYLGEAYKLRPTEFETLRLLGIANGIGGRFAEAEKYFSQALEQNDQHADTWFDLGVTQLNLGNMARHNACIAKAEALEPGIRERRSGRKN